MLIMWLWYGSMAVILAGCIVSLYGAIRDNQKKINIGTAISIVGIIMTILCYMLPPMPV